MPVLMTLLSVVLVSLISFIGILTLSFSQHTLKRILTILVSISAGTLIGDVFLHLLPESVENEWAWYAVIAGMLVFFVFEKFIHWHHRHPTKEHAHVGHHPSHVGFMNIAGDALHNLTDGLIIAGSYFVSVPVGIATTIAVVLHEIPQEIADFGVLIYSGMSRTRAILMNFLSATFAIVGAVIGLVIGAKADFFVAFIIPFTAGGFLYIAGANLIPELHKETRLRPSLFQLTGLIAGIGIMIALLSLE
ncbi:MAG TPA: ZIP family metal transporter [Candidatus Nanoarchaeia archaeon]|nr:ZIP family metal transporter [Candidatus Nanoarchaeia archaeon]